MALRDELLLSGYAESPGYLTSALVAQGAQALNLVLAQGPARWLDLVNIGLGTPWVDERQTRQRMKAALALRSDAKAVASTIGKRLVGGSMSAAHWSDAMSLLAQQYATAAGQLGAGTFSIGRLTNLGSILGGQHELTTQALAALADKLAAGDATEKQVAAWGRAVVGGATHTAFTIAGVSEEAGPVRRVMTAEADHCSSCPPKARTYATLDECIASCGGLPGDGSDDCCGNCQCHLEPASRTSVFSNTAQMLVAHGGAHQFLARQ